MEDEINKVREVLDLNVGIINNPRLYREREDPFDKYSDYVFRKRYRFEKDEVREIVNMLELPDYVSNRGLPIPKDLQVIVALRYFGRGQIQDEAGDLHGMSQPTVSRLITRVAIALTNLRRQHIFMPRNREEELEHMRGFFDLANFPRVIGAIDGTHIPISSPGGPLAQLYINRKNWYSLNCQVIVGYDGKILDIAARWRGSAHDSRIFNESRIKRRLVGGDFTGLLISDSGYACTNYLLTPVFNPENHNQERYNASHISTRNVVERTFGRWKQKFRILLKGVSTKLATTKIIIVALSVLHNFAVECHGPDYDDDDDDDDDNNNLLEQPDNIPVQNANARNAFRNAFIQSFFLH